LSKKLYFICGPTAVGKSSLAIRLAKKINGTIVNSDSMQVYSNLKVLTARPSENDHYIIDHKLYGYISGSERYNVSKWCNDVVKILDKKDNNKNPLIIVGGTGMYISSLLNGLIDLPFISENFKNESEKIINEKGVQNFINIIKEFDSDSLKRISYNDILRLKRIWEVYKSTGIPLSEWKRKKNKNFLNNTSYSIFLFLPSRENIYERVNNRFEEMLKHGAIEEVERLLKLKLDHSLPIMRAHGVPEIEKYLNKKFSLEECIKEGQKVTRNYVKRQLTWWRSSNLPIHQVFTKFPDEINENMIKI